MAYIFSLSVLSLEPSQHRRSYLLQNVHAEKEDTHALFDGECSKINLHPRICPWPCQRSKHRTPCVVYFVYHPPGFFFQDLSLLLKVRLTKKKKKKEVIWYTQRRMKKRVWGYYLCYLCICFLACLCVCWDAGNYTQDTLDNCLIIAKAQNYRDTSNLHY